MQVALGANTENPWLSLSSSFFSSVTAGGDAKEDNEASLKRTSTMAETIQVRSVL